MYPQPDLLSTGVYSEQLFPLYVQKSEQEYNLTERKCGLRVEFKGRMLDKDDYTALLGIVRLFSLEKYKIEKK